MNSVNTVTRIISFIPEELINEIYLKIVNHSKGYEYVSTKFNFYITIYADGEMIRSRMLNSKGDVAHNDSTSEKHKAFYKKSLNLFGDNRSRIVRNGSSEENSALSLFKVGNVVVIVSDENLRACEICAAVIGILFLSYKALSLKKEGIQFDDLKPFFKEQEDNTMLWYLQQVGNVMKGIGSF
jgi:hypothetical protein